MSTIKELKKRAHPLRPVLRIGKSGITDSFIDHTKELLKKQDLIKIKILPSALDNVDRKSTARMISEKTGAKLVDQIGLVIVLYKRNGSKT